MLLKQQLHCLLCRHFASLFTKPLLMFYHTRFDGGRFLERHSVPTAVMEVSVTDKWAPSTPLAPTSSTHLGGGKVAEIKPRVVSSVQQQDERLHQTAVNKFGLKVTDKAGDANIFHFLCLLQHSLANIWLA